MGVIARSRDSATWRSRTKSVKAYFRGLSLSAVARLSATKRSTYSRALVALALLFAAAGILAYMISMPGKSYSGPLQPLTGEESQIAEYLRRHVIAVAGREHNMFKPDALEAAARYIEASLVTLGYAVEPLPYETRMGTARNV